MRSRLFLLIVCLYSLFFVLYPPFQGNDEPDHFQYIYWLANGVYPNLPLKKGITAFDPTIQKVYDLMEVVANDENIPNTQKIKQAVRNNISFETNAKKDYPLTHQVQHPPLYHILALPFFASFYYFQQGLIPTYYATRLISAFFYFFSVIVAVRIAKHLFQNKTIGEYLVFVFAINPVTLKMGVSVNPDIAITGISLFLFLFLLPLSKKKTIPGKTLILLSILLAVAQYIKFQTIVFFPAVFFFFLVRGMQTKQVAAFMKKSFFVLVLSGLFVSPLFIHSFMKYHSITPGSIPYTIFCTANLAPIPWYRIPFETVFEFRHGLYQFAGFLGWGEPYPFKPFFFTYAAVLSLLVCMGVYMSIRQKKNQWLFLIGYLAVVYSFYLAVSFTYKIERYSCDIQGRYLLPGFFALVVFAWKGMTVLWKSREEFVARIFFYFSLWQYFFIVCFVLIPRYYV